LFHRSNPRIFSATTKLRHGQFIVLLLKKIQGATVLLIYNRDKEALELFIAL
jgi:hypothetical protein